MFGQQISPAIAFEAAVPALCSLEFFLLDLPPDIPPSSLC